MSELHERDPWWERYWQVLLILFGLLFITMLLTLK